MSAWLGKWLNEEERQLLQHSIQELERVEGQQDLMFFGRIQGTKKDYNIIMGLDYWGKKLYPKV